MPRQRVPELMDDPAVPRETLDRSLRFIRAVNQNLGGTRALLAPLERWARDHDTARPFNLLDLGTGSADIPVAAVRWARERRIDLRVTAVDNHPTTLDLAREHIQRELGSDDPDETGITLLQADALKLTDRLTPQSFDAAHAGMFIHHLDELPALTVLRAMDRLATRGLVWNDLTRSTLAKIASVVITLSAGPVVKHDARASVRASFTPKEALNLAERAGWRTPRVRASFLHQRFTVLSEKWGPIGNPILREDNR